jgi:hypothetical protein
MRDLVAIREGDSHPYGSPMNSTLDYAIAVFAIALGLALVCGQLWALLWLLPTRASTINKVERGGKSPGRRDRRECLCGGRSDETPR